MAFDHRDEPEDGVFGFDNNDDDTDFDEDIRREMYDFGDDLEDEDWGSGGNEQAYDDWGNDEEDDWD
ncbi:MAG: hypothetical protein WBB45_01475 [Cyclobacteriaceae bacterium]